MVATTGDVVELIRVGTELLQELAPLVRELFDDDNLEAQAEERAILRGLRLQVLELLREQVTELAAVRRAQESKRSGGEERSVR
jgi:hypothetical protein